MPIVRTHRPHFGGLGQGYGPLASGAVCLGPTDPTTGQEQPISCSDPMCTYGDCGSTAAPAPGAQCLGPTINGVETQIACTDPMCTYGDCVNAPQPVRGTLPEGGLPPSTSPNVTNVLQITPKPAPTVSSTPGMPGYQPGLYPQPSMFSWFGQSTMMGGAMIPNWLFVVGALGVVAVIGAAKSRR